MYQEGIITKKQLEELLSKTSHLVVIKFGAAWCGPCKAMVRIIKPLSDKYPQILFVDIDVDKAEEVAREYNVSSVPYFVFIKQKKKLYSTTGAMQEAAFEKLLLTYK